MPQAHSKLPSSLSTFLFVIILCIIGFHTLHHHHHPHTSSHRELRFHQIFLSSANNDTISSYLKTLTQHPHLAGTNPSLSTIHFVRSHFQSLGLETYTVPYTTLLSYPSHSSLSVHFPNGTSISLQLTELGHSSPGLIQPYHAYSPSGSVLSMVVFVNYGREEDYHALRALGVNVTGCIVMARKGEALSRGDVVRKAEFHGAAAVLLYAEGDKFRSGVERGTVMRGVGDPLTPGWAGVNGSETLDLQDDEVLKRFPKIPSMPLSIENAEKILVSLGGPPVPEEWRRTLKSGLGYAGPGPTTLNFTYKGEMKMETIYNVFAVIRGLKESDRYILLGNHRDAWTYGAVDPNSGTAALLDIARRYALLMRMGWKPRRTIILCSWDAEEFGMIGSTEWVEQNLVNLGSKAVAYLNVDCAVQGPGFFAGATPQLDNILIEVTKKVKDPDSDDATIYDKWATKNGVTNIQRLGGVDSDFAPFVQHAGIPSVDLFYGLDFPVYHTAFDSYNWMTTYGDLLFQRHVAVADVWGLLALHLADDPVLPFNYLPYADELHLYGDVLTKLVDSSISLHPLIIAIEDFTSAAKEAEDEAKKLREQDDAGDVALKQRQLNDRLMLAERGFLDADGIPGRQWFKHLVYGPHGDYVSKLVFFPGIADAIFQPRSSERERRATIQREIWRVSRAIQRAASVLRGEVFSKD